MTEQQLRQAADFWDAKRLKSDNIELGSIIPLPSGKKGVVVEEVKDIGNKRIQAGISAAK